MPDVSIWFTEPDLAHMNETGTPSLVGRLGISFTECGSDFIRATMPVDERTRQPFGVLHGGASAALAETVASYAALHCVDQAKYFVAGIELNINHLRPVFDGHVSAMCQPVHLGRTTQVWTVDIFDKNSALVAVSRLTVAVVERS